MTKTVNYAIVDAFTPTPFGGNGAGLVLVGGPANEGLELTEKEMRNIAAEINLSETAFLRPLPKVSLSTYQLRWLTPTSEVKLCGHATLASTFYLSSLGQSTDPKTGGYTFQTLWSGDLICKALPKSAGGFGFELDFPDDVPEEITDKEILSEVDDRLSEAFKGAEGIKITRVLKGKFDKVIEVELTGDKALGDYEVNASAFSGSGYRAVCVTTVLSKPASTTSSEPSFNSRLFAPDLGIAEDPVTGSLHCTLAPLYTDKFYPDLPVGEEVQLKATQGGPRRGEIGVVWKKDVERVLLRGDGVLVAKGEMYLA